jgi:hypothetical protein
MITAEGIIGKLVSFIINKAISKLVDLPFDKRRKACRSLTKLHYSLQALDDVTEDFRRTLDDFQESGDAYAIGNALDNHAYGVGLATNMFLDLGHELAAIIWSMRSPGSSSSRFDRVSITPEIPLFDRSPQMSVEFTGPGGTFHWRPYHFVKMLDLAHAQGWREPEILPPTDWAHALSLAAALEAALPDIPDINTIPLEHVVVYRPESHGGRRDMRQIGHTMEIEDVEHDPQSEGILDFVEVRWPSREVFIGVPVRWYGEEIWALDPNLVDLTSYQVFSGENKAEIVEFIAFLRRLEHREMDETP